MSRKSLEYLELKGSPQDVAHQLGQRRRAKIHKRIDFWNRHVSRVFKGSLKNLATLEAQFLREAKRGAKSFLEEIAAMADGAQVPFPDLFRLNLTELVPYAEKCTDLIFSLNTPKGRRILIAHNEDWDPARNDIFVLKVRTPYLRYVTLSYDGYLPGLSAGLNSFGLCHSVNYLQPGDFRMGIPRIFLTRYLLTAHSIKDCLLFFRKAHRAFGQSIHLAEAENYLNLELTATHQCLRRPRLPTVHTNHYLGEPLIKYASRPALPSISRYKQAVRLLKEIKIPKNGLSLAEAKRISVKILSDRKTYPYAIWREKDHPEELSATLAASILGTYGPEMEVYRRRPSTSLPKRFTL